MASFWSVSARFTVICLELSDGSLPDDDCSSVCHVE